MREHVGVDVDSIEEDQLMSRQPVADSDDIETWDPDHEQDREGDDHRAGVTSIKRRTARERLMRTVNTGMGQGECFLSFGRQLDWMKMLIFQSRRDCLRT